MESESRNNTWNKLRQLIGLDNIVNQFEHYLNVWETCREKGEKFCPNMVFKGNPGTGKSTVGRLLSEILHEEGLLPQALFVETHPSQLISPFGGGTKEQSLAIYEKAKGGILFIDEAYNLASYETEALDILFHFMMDNQDTLVILAGYTDGLNDFYNSNLAVQRHFTNVFLFKDYTDNELTEIFRKKLEAKHYIYGEDVLLHATQYFSSIYRDRSFTNAYETERLLESVISRQSTRLNGTDNLSAEDILTILSKDFPNHKDIEPQNSIRHEIESPNEDIQNNSLNNMRNEALTEESPVSNIDNTFEDKEDKEDKKEKKDKEQSCELDFSLQIDTIKESISSIREIVDNIQFNVAMLVQNQATAADVAVLQRENEAFRSDSNMKLMRRYGIDAMIKTYQTICDRVFRINHPRTDSSDRNAELDTLNWVLKRLEKQFKPLGIKLKSSLPGSAIDESVMVVYGSNGEDVDDEETMFETKDENLKDTVKESVCPAFIWTIPSLIGDVKEWCMEVEKVCIYK